MQIKPLPEKELSDRIRNIDKIVSEFRSFEDVIEYILALEELENRFYDPLGVLTAVEEFLNE